MMSMTILKSAVVYFAIVFGAGFVLGTLRTLWVVQRVGTRMAELLELPLMLAAVFLAARFINQRFDAVRGPWTRFVIGIVALVLLLTAELVLGVALRGVTPKEALVNRDLMSGTAYYVAVCVFALMPWFLGIRFRRMDDPTCPACWRTVRFNDQEVGRDDTHGAESR
jgi:hypothetical protein